MRVTLSLPLMALALASLCTAQEAAWQTWLIQTNKYRCMHDAPFLDWDACVATSAQKWADQGAFQHSDSYSLAPCAGPAGENLAKGQRSIEEAVSDWYSEASEWTEGSDGFSGSTGHFTAMVWRGASKLGCGWNDDQQLFVCRYKGGDQLDCDTPNMSGCFAENVPRRNGKSEAQCEQEARAAIGADADDSPDVAPPETTQPPKPVATTTRKSLRASTTKAPQPTQQWQPSWSSTLPPTPPPAETPTTAPALLPWQRPTRGGDWWRNRWGRSDSADSLWGHHYSLVQTGDTADGTPMPQPFSGQSGQPYWNEVSMPFGYTASRSNPTPPGTYVPQPPPPGVKPAPAPWGVGGQGGGYTPSQPHQYNVPDKVEIPGNIGGGGPYASGGLWWKAMQDVKKKLEGDPSALPDSLKQLLGKTEQIFGPGGDITAGLGSMMGDYIGEMGGNLAKDSKFGAFQKLLGGNIDSMIASAIGMLDPKAAGGLGGIASKVIDSLAGNFANNPAFKQFKANALGALGEAGNELLKQALPKVTDANLKSLLEKAAPAIQQIIAGAKKTALIETGHHSEEAAATGRRLAEQLLQFSAVSQEEAAFLEESGAPTTTPYPWYNSPYGWMMPPTLGPYYTPPSASGYYGFDQLRYSDKDAAWYQKMYGMSGSFGGDLSSLNGLLSIGMKLLNPKGIGGQIGSILMGAVDQLAGPALGGTSGFQAFRGNVGGLANLFMSSGLNLLNGGYGANTGTGLQGALGGVVKQLIGGAATGSGLASNPLFSVFQKTATSALTKGIGSLASAMLPGAGGLVTTLVPMVSSLVNKVMGRSLLQMQTRQHGMSLIDMVPPMESTLDYAPAFPSGEVAPPPHAVREQPNNAAVSETTRGGDATDILI